MCRDMHKSYEFSGVNFRYSTRCDANHTKHLSNELRAEVRAPVSLSATLAMMIPTSTSTPSR